MQEVVDVLAVARLSKLVRNDVLTKDLREAVLGVIYTKRGVRATHPSVDSWQDYAFLDRQPPKTVTLLSCPWCISVWLAVGVWAARRAAPALWDPLARVLAASYVAGVLAQHEGD